MEAEDRHRLLQQATALCQRSPLAKLLKKYLKLPDKYANAIVGATASLGVYLAFGAAAVSDGVASFLPLYVLFSHKVNFKERRSKTLVAYLMLLQLLHLVETLRSKTLFRVLARLVEGTRWTRTYYLLKTAALAALIQCDVDAFKFLRVFVTNPPQLGMLANTKVARFFSSMDTPVKTEQRREDAAAGGGGGFDSQGEEVEMEHGAEDVQDELGLGGDHQDAAMFNHHQQQYDLDAGPHKPQPEVVQHQEPVRTE